MTAAKTAALGLVCAVGAGILGGCSFSHGLGNDDLFQIEKETCPLSQAKVLLLNYQNQYEDLYGVNLWDEKSGQKENLEVYVKELTVTELADIYTLNLLGQDKEIQLNETEKEHADQAAKEYFTSLSEDEKEYTRITQEEMTELYERYALAEKVGLSLQENVSQDVSREEAKVMKARQIFMTSEDTAKKVKAQLDKGADFEVLAREYSETAKESVNLDRSMFSQEDQEKIFNLKEKEVSDVIQMSDGYYIFRCEKSCDEKLTKANKEKILENRKQEAVEQACSEYAKGADSAVNKKAWEQVKPDTCGAGADCGFFDTFEQYCSGDYKEAENSAK